ncbi:hypothetical protein FB451DRAFT_1173061 [Mycena latifolia]|nr:hypothetical protein FB451DRAFT_1173061 [Mycena latifolia]
MHGLLQDAENQDTAKTLPASRGPETAERHTDEIYCSRDTETLLRQEKCMRSRAAPMRHEHQVLSRQVGDCRPYQFGTETSNPNSASASCAEPPCRFGRYLHPPLRPLATLTQYHFGAPLRIPSHIPGPGILGLSRRQLLARHFYTKRCFHAQAIFSGQITEILDRMCKAAQSRIQLLCIVQSRMRHRGRRKCGKWLKNALFGQNCGHSRTAAVAKPNNDMKVVHLMLAESGKWAEDAHGVMVVRFTSSLLDPSHRLRRHAILSEYLSPSETTPFPRGILDLESWFVFDQIENGTPRARFAFNLPETPT